MGVRKITKSNFLELLLENFGAGSVSKKLASDITSTFPVNSFVLENNVCNLAKTDISFPLYRKNNDFSNFLRKNSITTKNYPKWVGVISTIKNFNTKSEYSFVDEVWLEFDENGYDSLHNCLPGFYFNVLNYTPKINHLITELVFKLRGGPTMMDLIDKINMILSFSGSGCEYLGVGIFSGRMNRPIRIGYLIPIARAIELSKHYRIDDKIIDFLTTEHPFIGEKVIVHFNINETEVSFQGIELYSRDNKSWELVYDSLLKHSLCNLNLKSHISSWKKIYSINSDIEAPPKQKNKEISYPLYCFCRINHFKLINNNSLDLKVYLNVDFVDKINYPKMKLITEKM